MYRGIEETRKKTLEKCMVGNQLATTWLGIYIETARVLTKDQMKPKQLVNWDDL